MTFIRVGLSRIAILRGTTTAASTEGATTTARATTTAISTNPRRTRGYASTASLTASDDGDDNATTSNTKSQDQNHQRHTAALQYNSDRASYKRAVGNLRRRYREDHIAAEASDRASRDAEIATTTRRRLERQRAKNERTFRNALRQEELRRQAHAAFEDRLRVQQEKRDKDHELHQRARQLLIDDLEEEAHLWLTTPEEVHRAFDDPATEQELWARPQGVLGVPNPSLDSHFWSYEGHTWDRSKTYKTKSELLLEELEQQAFEKTNVDRSHWTDDKVEAAETRETKAQLRANVRLAGRRSLLRRQREYLGEEEAGAGEVPTPPPVPSLGVLGNTKAQEKEGADLLRKDPTQFFVFEGQTNSGNDQDDGGAYEGSSLGAPIALRDPLRTGKPQGRVFPVPVGKLPKPDLRSEKEKKRQEREERLWAAAGKGGDGDASDEDMLLAEEDREIGEAIDYEEAHAEWDSDDEEWEKGLDRDLDKDLLGVPREYRYRDEDLDAVIEGLEARAASMQSHVANTIKTMEQEALSRLDTASAGGGEPGAESETKEAAEASPFFDADTTAKLTAMGADVDKYELLMASLTEEQLLALFALEAKELRESSSSSATADGKPDATTEAASTGVFASVGGLTDNQIEGLTELESFLKVAEQES